MLRATGHPWPGCSSAPIVDSEAFTIAFERGAVVAREVVMRSPPDVELDARR